MRRPSLCSAGEVIRPAAVMNLPDALKKRRRKLAGGMLLGLVLGVLLGLLLTSSVAHAQPARAPTTLPVPERPPAPDTLALTLPQAEALFLQKNLLLLATRFNISAAEAQIQQARLWDNPTVYVEQNVWRPAAGELPAAVLPTGYNGENIVTVQQLLLLAGKRRARTALARTDVQLEELNFQEVLRTLRFQLRTAFYQLYYQRQSLRLYDSEIGRFQTTVDLYQQEYGKGNVALKDVIRLRAFLTQLLNERQQLRADVAEQQTALHTLLSSASGEFIRPQVVSAELDARGLPPLSVAQLLDSARRNRPDLRLTQTQLTARQQNITLQRKLAVPDLTVGYTYDRQGSYIRNYNALSVGLPLPLFNRNQGNIRTAQAQARAQELLVDQQNTAVAAEVQEAYAKALNAERLYRATDPAFATDFDRLLDNIAQSYGRRTVSLVEYLDFLEAYKSTIIQRNQLQLDRLTALEQLDFVTNSALSR